MTDGSAYAVIARITAAYYDNVLVLGGYESAVRKVGIKQALGCRFKEVNCEVYTLCVSAFCLDITRI